MPGVLKARGEVIKSHFKVAHRRLHFFAVSEAQDL